MDLIPALSSEQQMLLDATTRLLDASCPIETVRAFADGGPRTDATLRARAAELGWYGLLVEARHGGGNLSGNGVVDAALISAALGFRLQPGAFVPTSLVAFALSCADQPATPTCSIGSCRGRRRRRGRSTGSPVAAPHCSTRSARTTAWCCRGSSPPYRTPTPATSSW
jgi:alkylation response protein AidB-like acyl-CoA dehydrogenase